MTRQEYDAKIMEQEQCLTVSGKQINRSYIKDCYIESLEAQVKELEARYNKALDELGGKAIACPDGHQVCPYVESDGVCCRDCWRMSLEATHE